MIAIQLILYCLLFTGMVALATGGKAINVLYFYPKSVQERAFAMGLADRKITEKKRKLFMLPFAFVMIIALLLIIGLWNKAADYKSAYLQALLFLEVMNWYDGIVIDRLWVGHSKFWVLPGLENVPFVQTWAQVLKKRTILTLVWLVGAAAAAGLVIWIF